MLKINFKGGIYMTNNFWNFFEHTGQIEAYLTYLEFRRLTSKEFAEEMDKIQEEKYGRESLRLGNQGDGLSGE